MNDEKYIGLDVHQATIVVAVMDSTGKLVMESAFSIVETVCRNVKRWRAGDHIERWVGSGLLVAERQFRKVQGYREIPSLLTSLANMLSKKAVAEEVKVA